MDVTDLIVTVLCLLFIFAFIEHRAYFMYDNKEVLIIAKLKPTTNYSIGNFIVMKFHVLVFVSND